MCAFTGAFTLLFAVSTAITVVWSASMSSMGGMPMPGGWTMSMAWMRMPGQTWPDAAVSFVGMWAAMMIAMMLPSLVPTLWRYREAAIDTGETCVGRLIALVATGYFFVWTVVGMAAFPFGVMLTRVEMQQPSLSHGVPVAIGVVVAIAGVLQLSVWKARQLEHCREVPVEPAGVRKAWRFGLCLGVHCNLACASLTAILLVIGVMDLRAMAVVGAAITAERLAPSSDRIARATGFVAVGVGVLLIVRAAVLG